LIIDHWKDASTVKYDTEDCITFKIRALDKIFYIRDKIFLRRTSKEHVITT